jgi:hypothetical protein
MKRLGRTLAFALASAACAAAQDARDFDQFRREAFQRENQGRWKTIHWQKTMAQALEDARSQKKPVLVFLVVGEMGRQNAPEC